MSESDPGAIPGGGLESQVSHRPAHGLRNASHLFVILLATWLALTSNVHWQALLTGAIVSLALTAFLARTYARLGLPPFSLKRLWFFCAYLAVLLQEIIRANFDVACRVLHPRLPIRPGIVVI